MILVIDVGNTNTEIGSLKTTKSSAPGDLFQKRPGPLMNMQ